MKNYTLIDSTDSAEQFSKSLEFLLPGSLVKSKVLSNNFSSEGHGVLSKGFYLGNNKTKNLAELEIINLRSCVFSIPLKGKYTTYVSNKLFSECTPERGCLFLPADSIKYATETSLVNDLSIFHNNVTIAMQRIFHVIVNVLQVKTAPLQNVIYFFQLLFVFISYEAYRNLPKLLHYQTLIQAIKIDLVGAYWQCDIHYNICICSNDMTFA